MAMDRTMKTLDREHRIDRQLGRTLGTMRRSAGVSLECLAERTGLPIEELADHEAGLLPIPLSRLLGLIEALGSEAC